MSSKVILLITDNNLLDTEKNLTITNNILRKKKRDKSLLKLASVKYNHKNMKRLFLWYILKNIKGVIPKHLHCLKIHSLVW